MLIERLNEPIGSYVRIRDPVSLDEAIEAAIKKESVIARKRNIAALINSRFYNWPCSIGDNQ